MKRTFKKGLSFLLVVTIILSVVGCISSGLDSTTENTTPSTESTVALTESGISTTVSTKEPDSSSVTSIPAESKPVGGGSAVTLSVSDIPTYSGNPFIVINDNVPNFSADELTTVGYENYSQLDSLGRCGVAVASLGVETRPADGEKRGDISSIKPTGWVQAKYDGISGGYIWNRCHLIGWQLSAENANRQNLITGTRYFNIDGMLPFENMVADYIKEYPSNHVAYRVSPVFDGNNLVCNGVQIEAYSVEDNGDGISFNVFCYNVQPDIVIDYITGDSFSTRVPETEQTEPPAKEEPQTEMVWVSKSGKKYHSNQFCSNMKNPSYISIQEAKGMGRTACSKCH